MNKINVFLIMTLLVQKSLPLRVFREMKRRGFDINLFYYVDAEGIYTPDYAHDFARDMRLVDCRGVSQQDFGKRILEIILSRNIQIIVQNGCEPIYPLLPLIKSRFPYIQIIDMQYNTVGHVVSHFLYENAVDAVFVESQAMNEFVQANSLKASPTVNVHSNGVNVNSLKPARSGRSKPGKLTIGYIGRMSAEKNPIGFVKLAEQLADRNPNLEFRMFGDGGQSSEVQRLIGASKFGDRISFEGFAADVATALAAVDLIVVPSILDGRPNIVMEANACGIPVIASPVGAIPELIVEGRNGWLHQPDDVEAIARRLGELLLDDAAYQLARQNARDEAVERFSEQAMYDAYEASLRMYGDRAQKLALALGR